MEYIQTATKNILGQHRPEKNKPGMNDEILNLLNEHGPTKTKQDKHKISDRTRKV